MNIFKKIWLKRFKKNNPDQSNKYNKYEVYIKGNYYLTLNENLAIKQNINDDQLERIKKLHIIKYVVFQIVNKLDTKKDIELIKNFMQIFHNIEYSLQEAWGFSKNKNFHRFWEFPHCCCPVLDNLERLGQDQFIYRQDCIIHGS